MILIKASTRFGRAWSRFWVQYSGPGTAGRAAARLAAWPNPPYKGRTRLARLSPRGYVCPSAEIRHSDLRMGSQVFIGDRVVIYQHRDGGPVELGDGVHLHNDTIIEVGSGGSVAIGAGTHIQPRCQFTANLAPIRIGQGVQIAPNCAFYPYNHGCSPGQPIIEQPLWTKGGIMVEDDAWLGYGVIVLDGVRIGKGAVVGAGSVVASNVPDGAIAVGAPARVVKMRSELSEMSEALNSS